MVLEQSKVDCFLWVGMEPLPQVEEFQCLGVSFKVRVRIKVTWVSLGIRMEGSENKIYK